MISKQHIEQQIVGDRLIKKKSDKNAIVDNLYKYADFLEAKGVYKEEFLQVALQLHLHGFVDLASPIISKELNEKVSRDMDAERHLLTESERASNDTSDKVNEILRRHGLSKGDIGRDTNGEERSPYIKR